MMTREEIQKFVDSYFSSNSDVIVSREKVRKDLTEKLYELFKSLNYNYDTTDSSFSQLLLNLFSAVIGDTVALSNFLYGESTLVTAQLYESVYNWARMLDYEPELSKPATTTLQLMFPFDNSFSFTLQPLETYFSTKDGVIFTPVEKVVIERRFDTTTNNPITIKRYFFKNNIQYEENIRYHIITSPTGVKQIVFNIPAVNLYKKEIEFVSDNVSSYINYEYSIDLDDNEFLNDIRVVVNGELFTRGNLQIATATSKVYDIVFRSKNSFTIRFGNNVNGVGIEPGSQINVSVIITNGSKGNIKKFDINDDFSVTDTTGVIEYRVVNITEGVGGIDNLSEEEIKYNTIVDLRTRKRIVTLEDYEDFVRRYKFVDKFKILQKESDNRTNDIYLYVSLKDQNGSIIPTETITVDYEELKQSLSYKLSQQGDVQIISSDDLLTKFEFNPVTNTTTTYKVPGYLLIDLTKYSWYLIPYDKILTDYKIYTFTSHNVFSNAEIYTYLYSDRTGYIVELQIKYDQNDTNIDSFLNSTVRKLLVTTRSETRSYTHVSNQFTLDSTGKKVLIVQYRVPFNELSVFRNRSDIRVEFYDRLTSTVTEIIAYDFTNMFYDYGPIYSIKGKLLILDIPVVKSDYGNIEDVMIMFRTLSDTFGNSTSARMLNHRTHVKFFKTLGTSKNVHFSKPDYYVIDILE